MVYCFLNILSVLEINKFSLRWLSSISKNYLSLVELIGVRH